MGTGGNGCGKGDAGGNARRTNGKERGRSAKKRTVEEEGERSACNAAGTKKQRKVDVGKACIFEPLSSKPVSSTYTYTYHSVQY